MRETTLILAAMLMLITGSTIATAGPAITASDSTIVVWMGKGKPGHLATREEITSQITPTYQAKLDSVSAGKLRLVIVCCTDPTHYSLLNILKDDPRFQGKDIDWDAQNLDWDGATNGAREASANEYLAYLGVDYLQVQVDYFHIRSTKHGDRYIKIHVADLLPNKKPFRPVIIEQTPASSVVNNVFKFNFGDKSDTARSNLSLSYMAGLRTTEFAVAPEAEVTLALNNELALQLWGFHSTFLRTERDTYLKDTETFDQGGGIRLGFRAYKSLWVLGGAYVEENVLSETEFAGKRPWWHTGADLTIALRRNNFAVAISGGYGHEWSFEDGLHDTADFRIAFVGGDTRRLK